MPKVLSIVSYKFLPPKMGGQKGIALFNNYLSAYVNITCVTTQNNDVSIGQGYTILNTLSNSKLRYVNLFYFFRIRKIIKQHKITHVLLEHPYLGWLGVLLKWFCGVKLLVHSHNIESLRFKSMRKWWWGILWNYERYVHRRASFSFFIQDNDKAYAINKFRLQPALCTTITYGIEIAAIPSQEEKSTAGKKIRELYGIDEQAKILLFNGTLDYKPNSDALDAILEKINPTLLDSDFIYKIIIAGSRLPKKYDNLEAYKQQHIIYAGFVDDITLYFKGADIFINPVIDGGGIKTKIVEALGYDLSVISNESGAIGIPAETVSNKMKIIADGQWEEFARQVSLLDISATTPTQFFDHFYWGNIASKAAAVVKAL